jgi:hypothetical protein
MVMDECVNSGLRHDAALQDSQSPKPAQLDARSSPHLLEYPEVGLFGLEERTVRVCLRWRAHVDGRRSQTCIVDVQSI